jgi:hypothetical protein
VRLFRARLFGHEEVDEGIESEPLTVPAWMWNSQEWIAFTQASAGYQRPLLLQALRGLRSGADTTEEPGTAASSSYSRLPQLGGCHLATRARSVWRRLVHPNAVRRPSPRSR